MSITRKLKELIVAFGGAQNVNAVQGNRIDGLIGTLAAYIAEHGAGGGASLPTVTGTDNGKLLGVSSGAWAAVTAPTELPAVTGDDNGKVLGVSSGAWAAVAAPGGLPTVAAADNGKALQVSSGAWAAVKTRLDVSFTVTSGEGGALSATANGTTFADIVAAFAAQQDIVAWIVLPSGAVMTTRSFTLDSVSTPTSIWFGVLADLSHVGETYAPTFYQITMSAQGFDVRAEPLTVAT